MVWTGDVSDAAECSELFARRIALLRPVRCEPTINEDDERYEPTPREVELTERVCLQDCLVALATARLRRHLCVSVIKAEGPQRVLILGERIGEDDDFFGFLQILLPADVRVVRRPTSCWSRAMFEGVRLVEPDVFVEFVSRGLRPSSDMFGVVILLDFQHYLEPEHPYRKIVTVIQNCREEERQVSSDCRMRLLALVSKLDVSSLDSLESKLKVLRTPMKLTCCLGTTGRPHSKEREIQVRKLHLDRRTLDPTGTAPFFDADEVNELGKTLRDHGLLAMHFQAEKIVAARPRPVPRDFFSQCRSQLAALKTTAVLECCRGRTLALVTSTRSLRDLKEHIRRDGSVPLVEKQVPVNVAPESVGRPGGHDGRPADAVPSQVGSRRALRPAFRRLVRRAAREGLQRSGPRGGPRVEDLEGNPAAAR
ncbi:uncharacterized protein LOC119454046 [Dermacentor silvarum]|uniref:uncharacterized protein LOC119454046 n=1 Tax=Dermacentor silvarum TaxID=543639 RepID=UPI002100D6FA|nr:uncharacterized protein LOC119454046 [Dermacentor silvarum]